VLLEDLVVAGMQPAAYLPISSCSTLGAEWVAVSPDRCWVGRAVPSRHVVPTNTIPASFAAGKKPCCCRAGSKGL